MDIIDTTLRVGSREKLHPKHGYDEEVCGGRHLIKFSYLIRQTLTNTSFNLSKNSFDIVSL